MPAINIPHTPNQEEKDSFSPTRFGRRGRPMLFQVVDPVNRPLWNYLLALHTNPNSFSEKMAKSKSVVMTYGGFVEFIWPDELDSISGSHSTGAFIGPFTGLTSGSEGRPMTNDRSGLAIKAAEHGRHGTIAWERQEDLLEVFRHNGNIFNGRGQPAVRGRVMCIYDRGVYLGHFTTFHVKESEEKPFSFELDWEFKAEQTLYNFPISPNVGISPEGAVFVSEVDRARRRVGEDKADVAALRKMLNLPATTEPTPQQKTQSSTSGNGPQVPPNPPEYMTQEQRSAVDLSDDMTAEERRQALDEQFSGPPE
jgi:hypothetical protein